MSPAERSVRHGKLRTDRAISQAYTRLAADGASASIRWLIICWVSTRFQRSSARRGLPQTIDTRRRNDDGSSRTRLAPVSGR